MEHDFKKTMINGKDILSSESKQDREYKVINYDFKRPDKFSLEQIRTISIMHETFSRLSSASLSAMIRKKVDVHVSSVDQMTLEEFLESLPNPTAMAIVQMSPLRGSALLEIDPSVSSTIIDRIFGGSGTVEQEGKKLSLLEMPILSKVSDNLLRNLNESWKPLIDLEASVGQIETNPQFSLIAPPTEMVILISVEIAIDDTKGFMNLCIPYLTIEPLIEKLSAQFWYSKARTKRGDCIPAGNIAALKLDCDVLTEAEELSLKQIGQLRKGSLVKLPFFGEGLSTLRAGGEPIMELAMKKNRSAMTFSLRSSRLAQSGIVPDFLKEEVPEEHHREDQFAMLSAQLKDLVGTLTDRIDQLSDNQVQLSDQVFFQSEGDHPARGGDKEPFAFIGLPDLPVLHEMLAEENIQAVALILSRLDSGMSAELLRRFDEAKQPELIRRIGLMERVAPEVLGEVENFIKNRLDIISKSLDPDVKGVEKVTQILNVSSRSVESHVIHRLEKSDGDLAEEIKKRMFVFEDIVLLDPKAVAKVALRVHMKDLCLAMKMVADEAVKNHILSSIPAEKREELLNCLEETGRVRISDVDKAQQKVVETIRRLEQEGEMILCRPEDMTD